jgi:hypothetical protein
MNSILYPENSILDQFMKEQGLQRGIKNNVKIVKGKVRLGKSKKNKRTESQLRSTEETVYNDGDNTDTKARKHAIKHTKNFFEKKKLIEEQEQED